MRTSGQDGGVGGYTVPPRTTNRRTTTNLKNRKQPELAENRIVWKSDNQEVKEEISRLVGGAEMGRWVERTRDKAAV